LGWQDLGGKDCLRGKTNSEFEEGKGRVEAALLFLFVSFGNHQLPGQPANADK